MLLRPATEADQPIIRTLVRQGNINPLGLDWRRFVVGENGAGEVVAGGQIKPHRDGSWELASIVVRPDHRGRGLARAVIEHLLAAHPHDLYLMCRANLGQLYEKFGFRAIDAPEMPRYFRRIKKLVGLAEFLGREGESLLVMKWDG